jgi:UDP-glucose:(heptosyl)LPS alpha-1,3-glucosyltransferase
MKLLFCLFNYFPYGGLQKDCLMLAKACAAKGHEVHIVTGSWVGDQPSGITITVLKTQGLFNHVWVDKFNAQCAHYFSQNHFDLIIGFNRIPGIDVYYAADLCYQEQYNHFPWYKKIMPRARAYLRMEKILCAQDHTHFLLLTESAIDQFMHYYHLQRSRLHLIPLGLDKTQYPLTDYDSAQQQALKQHFHIPVQDKLILFVGSNFKLKGLDRAFRAIASLPKNIQKTLHFWIVGNDDEKSYMHLIKQLSISTQVKFLGGHDDMPQLYRAADLLLHPAHQESAGNVLIEAMGSGLPILTNDTCGYAHNVTIAQAGIVLSSPFRQMQLNQSLGDLLSKPNHQMRQNGINFCREQHVHARIDQLVKLVETLP